MNTKDLLMLITTLGNVMAAYEDGHSTLAETNKNGQVVIVNEVCFDYEDFKYLLHLYGKIRPLIISTIRNEELTEDSRGEVDHE